MEDKSRHGHVEKVEMFHLFFVKTKLILRPPEKGLFLFGFGDFEGLSNEDGSQPVVDGQRQGQTGLVTRQVKVHFGKNRLANLRRDRVERFFQDQI